jgi:hypothetical protein
MARKTHAMAKNDSLANQSVTKHSLKKYHECLNIWGTATQVTYTTSISSSSSTLS